MRVTLSRNRPTLQQERSPQIIHAPSIAKQRISVDPKVGTLVEKPTSIIWSFKLMDGGDDGTDKVACRGTIVWFICIGAPKLQEGKKPCVNKVQPFFWARVS